MWVAGRSNCADWSSRARKGLWSSIVTFGKWGISGVKLCLILAALWGLPESCLNKIKFHWYNEWGRACMPWTGNSAAIKRHWANGFGDAEEFIRKLKNMSAGEILGSAWAKGMAMTAISEVVVARSSGAFWKLAELNGTVIFYWFGGWMTKELLAKMEAVPESSEKSTRSTKGVVPCSKNLKT